MPSVVQLVRATSTTTRQGVDPLGAAAGASSEYDLTRHRRVAKGYLRMPARLAFPCMMVSALALLSWSTYRSRIPLMGAVSLR